MLRKSIILLLIALGTLLLSFGCKCKVQKSPPAVEAEAPQAASAKPQSLKEAIQLYETSFHPLDAEESVRVFYSNAYGNDPEAQYYLGLARWEGRGAEQSELEAYVWWTIAARQYHLDSMNRIENVKEIFSREDLAEIDNRAKDWAEKVRNTPEMQ